MSGPEQIHAIREFNRFYTARLGLLRKRHLNGRFSLTEARILYEIGNAPQRTASSLRQLLELDAGYISRLLAQLTRQGLIRQTPSRADGREKLLTLTAAGQREARRLDEQSSLQIHDLLQPLSPADRAALAESLTRVCTLLDRKGAAETSIRRVSRLGDDALRLFTEYYESIGVVKRDTPAELRRMLRDGSGVFWIAYRGAEAVGCVVLRTSLSGIPHAAECKRLYLRPAARGLGLANALLEAQEQYARELGLHWIYLDTFPGLRAAVALYRKRGYRRCARYNDNPQATLFLRKSLRTSSPGKTSDSAMNAPKAHDKARPPRQRKP